MLETAAPRSVRGACAVWRQTGYLGGMGQGGGAGLWLATHAGGFRVAAIVALWNLLRTRVGVFAAVAVTLPAGLGPVRHSTATCFHATLSQ
jgi:hypothetical protein